MRDKGGERGCVGFIGIFDEAHVEWKGALICLAIVSVPIDNCLFTTAQCQFMDLQFPKHNFQPLCCLIHKCFLKWVKKTETICPVS